MDAYDLRIADQFENVVNPCSACNGMIRYMGQLGSRVHGRCENCGLETAKMEAELFLPAAVRDHHASFTPKDPMPITYDVWRATVTLEFGLPKANQPHDAVLAVTNRLFDDVAKLRALLVELDRLGGLGNARHEQIRAVLGGTTSRGGQALDQVNITEAAVAKTEREYTR